MEPGPGSRGARILGGMRAAAKTTFSTQELADFAGVGWNDHAAHVAVNRLVKRGLLVRVSAALYALPDRTPELINLVVWRVNTQRWFLSHRSAMAMHGFGPPLPHPTLMVTVDVDRRDREVTSALSLEFVVRHSKLHGEPVTMDIPGLGRLLVAEPETTLVDGLQDPKLCGGFLELCRFIAHRRGQWSGEKLLARVKPWHSDALERRLGLLMAWANDPCAAQLAALRPHGGAPPSWFVPAGPRAGKIEKTWRVRLNAQRDEVLAALTGAEGAPVPSCSGR